MNRTFCRYSTAVVLAVWCFGGASRVLAADAAAITLEEVTRRVTEWRNSFVNVRVVWELRTLPETDKAVDQWPPPPDPETAPLT